MRLGRREASERGPRPILYRKHVQFGSTLSKGRNFVRNCSVDIVAENGNSVEATFDFVERIVQLVAFDNVASKLLLVSVV